MKWNIYKKGQGYYTRLCSGAAGVVLSALASYRLYESMGSWLGGVDMDPNNKLIISAVVSVAMLVALFLLVFYLVNSPKCAEFMIETEGEMKKVNWPARKEVISSTKVVIVTVIAMAIVLGLVDIVFLWVFQAMGIVNAV